MLLEGDPEQEALRDFLAAVKTGAGRTIIVQGPAGIGKTTLLEELVSESASRGLHLLHPNEMASCRPQPVR